MSINVITEDRASGAQVIDGSLKFDSSLNQYLTKTFGSAGNRRTNTVSFWIKRSSVSDAFQRIFNCDTAGNALHEITLNFDASPDRDTLISEYYIGSQSRVKTNAVLRDISGWYHIVIIYNSLDSTQADRQIIYINGERQSLSNSVSVGQNNNGMFSSANEHRIGRGRTYASGTAFNGSMSQFYFIDGQALGPEYFGFTDPLTNTWRPKKVDLSEITSGKVFVENTHTGGSVGSGVYNASLTGTQTAGSFSGDTFTATNAGWVITFDLNEYDSFTLSDVTAAGQSNETWYYSNDSTFASGVTGPNSGTIANGTWSTTVSGTKYRYLRLQNVPSITFSVVGNITNPQNAWGTNGFYLPFDGNSLIGQDQSGQGNNWTSVNFGSSNSIEKATGALPILNTVNGGNVAIPGTRTDANSSNLVLAVPLVGNALDFHHIIKGSGSAKTFTINGDAAASSDQSNFYGGSFEFDGSGDYLQTADSSDFTVGSGDYTIEGWFYPENVSSTRRLCGQRASDASELQFLLETNSSGVLHYYFSISNSSYEVQGDALVANRWYHIAVTRNGNVHTLYVNGHSVGTRTQSGTLDDRAQPFSIGRQGNYTSDTFDGYIQDFRFYKGVAKYTQNFIPAATSPDILPDTPSGVSGSSKLTKITDGAVGFDGDDFLSLSNNADFQFGTGDFTIEEYFYMPAGTTMTDYWRASLAVGGDSNTENSATIYHTSSSGSSTSSVHGEVSYIGPSNSYRLYSGRDERGKWTHVAVTRESGTVRLFVDGDLRDTQSESTNYNATSGAKIGVSNTGQSNYFIGQISNVRVIKGTALYTSSFTPPTEPLTNVTNTKLLCCQDTNEFKNGAQPILNTNATGTTTTSGTRVDPFASSLVLALPFNGSNGGTTFTDQHALIKGSGSAKTISKNGNTQTSTAQSQYYGSSALFDGSGDNLTIPASSDFDFGTGAYTVEMWIKTSADAGWLWHNAQSVDQGLRVCVGNNGSNSSNAGKLEFNEQVSNGDVYTQSTSRVDDGNWHHFAICRSDSGGTRLYVDGIHEATGNSGRNFDNNNTVYIGMRASGGGSAFNGYIQDLRVYKGIAKYTSGFNVTAPSVEPAAAVSPSSIVAASAAVTNFNPFNTDINTVRGQETGYCTLNPLASGKAVMGSQRGSDVTFSDGNLKSTVGSPNNRESVGNIVVRSGKYYYEAMFDPGGSDDNSDGAGWVADSGLGRDNSTNGGFCMFARDNGSTVIGNGSSRTDETSGTHASFNRGDVMGCAIDLDSRIATWYKNGVKYSFEVDFSSRTNLDGQDFKPIVLNRLAGSVFVNFGQKPFKFPPPEGYTILSAPTVRPETVIARSDQYFDTKLYTGTTESPRTISGLSMTPDMIWVKNRTDDSTGHYLFDTVRGDNQNIRSDGNFTQSAVSGAAHGIISTTGKNSFTVKDGSSSGNNVGSTGTDDYVAWCWKAGGNESTFNVDGVGYATADAAGLSCTADLVGASIGTKQGFSIIRYQATNGETVAHGLSQQPGCMFMKNLDTSGDWNVYHRFGGDGDYLANNEVLNLNNGDPMSASGSNTFITGTSATTFTVGSSSIVQNGSDDFIAYIWHDVPGLQKFGHWKANNSTEGNFLNLGFRPGLIIAKQVSGSGSGMQWFMLDSKRNTSNPINNIVDANSSDNERQATIYDLTSNGAKIRIAFANNEHFIYMAWAETPTFNLYGAQSNAR